MAFNVPQLFVLLLSIKFGPRFSFKARIVWSMILICSVLLAIPLMTGYLPPLLSLEVTEHAAKLELYEDAETIKSRQFGFDSTTGYLFFAVLLVCVIGGLPY